jgi:Pyruvate/2-oxoacid:ferredoxin oxidoreductase delta subunit
MKVRRKIIKIDEELCDGCGNCVPGCPEQALQVVETPDGPKARLVKEFYCDGLGACLGTCPTGALSITEQEVDPYDEVATVDRIREKAPDMLEIHQQHMAEHAHEMHSAHEGHKGCPGAKVMHWDKAPCDESCTATRIGSHLRQWPVQLHLVRPDAPYFKNADIAFVADCVPIAYGDFHEDFLKKRAIAMGCPKFDDAQAYIDKIAQIIALSDPKSIEVVVMEVPCCSALETIVQHAIEKSGKKIAYKKSVIGIKGDRK